MKFEEFKTGDSFEIETDVTDEMVRDYARITGDNNPLHLDEEFAKTTPFGRRIAHGMLIASLISRVLGHDFPGAGTVYVSQSIRFRKPVYVGDTVKIRVEIRDMNTEKRRLYLSTTVNDYGKEVLTGEAEIFLPT